MKFFNTIPIKRLLINSKPGNESYSKIWIGHDHQTSPLLCEDKRIESLIIAKPDSSYRVLKNDHLFRRLRNVVDGSLVKNITPDISKTKFFNTIPIKRLLINSKPGNERYSKIWIHDHQTSPLLCEDKRIESLIIAKPDSSYRILKNDHLFRRLRNVVDGSLVKTVFYGIVPNRNYSTIVENEQNQLPSDLGDSSKNNEQVLYKTRDNKRRKVDKSGAMNFEDFLKSTEVWVDKSMLIECVLKFDSQAVLVTCPRKWGKSLNLSMMEYFFDNRLDEATKTMMKSFFTTGQFTDSDNERIEMSSTPLIAAHGDIIKKYLHSCPVIHLDFKSIREDRWYETFYAAIRPAFNKHRYLIDDWDEIIRDASLDSEKMHAENQKEKFQKIYNGTANEIEMVHSIKELSLWLKAHHKRPTIVLLDEFDALCNNILFGESITAKKPPKKHVFLMRDFMEATFKDCFKSGIEKVVLTGILRVANTTMMSGLNNILVDCNLIDLQNLAPFYGFSSSEVESLVKLAGIDYDKHRESIKIWYDGYRTEGSKEALFSPWSIMRYCQNNTFKRYFEATGSLSALKRLLNHRFIYEFMFELVVERKSITVRRSVLMQMSVDVYDVLYKLLRAEQSHWKLDNTTSRNGVIAILAQSGYLTCVEGTSDSENITLVIPNREILGTLRNIIDEHVFDTFLDNLKKDQKYDTLVKKCAASFNRWMMEDEGFEEMKKDLEMLLDMSDLSITNQLKKKKTKRKEGIFTEALLRRSILPVLFKICRNDEMILFEELDRSILVDGKLRKRKLDTAMMYEGTAVIIELKRDYTKTIDEVLQQAIKYTPLMAVYKEDYNLSQILYLAINFTKKRNVEMKCMRKSWDEVEAVIAEIGSCSPKDQTPA